mmetsp:Transcript_74882/g.206544  ORF Transcript_74882/g.206544 Transcript_74882/m.206544 type:complete len:109 (-) Transcript_74882:591-917(-)
MAEEQNRIEVTSIDIFDELNLQAIEPMYQPMNNFVLTPTWLDHASDIANTSLSDTPDGCVPTGITKLLLSPPEVALQRGSVHTKSTSTPSKYYWTTSNFIMIHLSHVS